MPERKISTKCDLEFERCCHIRSDIQSHLPRLRALASQCERVTELGVRHGLSSWALLSGVRDSLISYDIEYCPVAEELASAAQEASKLFSFRRCDTRAVDIEETELLFIDTDHTSEQLSAELSRHKRNVTRWIALHDTETFPSMCVAVLRQLVGWKIMEHYTECNGLTILERC